MKNRITSVNFHLTKVCNMKCTYCFAQFNKVSRSLDFEGSKRVINALRDAGFDKINFVGGEPFLVKNLESLIIFAKKIGFFTSVVTNGSLVSKAFLASVGNDLDMIGLSVDSLSERINRKIGRSTRSFVPSRTYYEKLCSDIISYGIRLKINTVVSTFNMNESFASFIQKVRPERWKVFQVLAIDGENEIEGCYISNKQFNRFAERHEQVSSVLIAESNNILKGSYVMVDPTGSFFDNSKGKYSISSSILTVGIEKALSQVDVSFDKFESRNGNYYKIKADLV